MENLVDDFIKYKPNRSLSTNKQYATRVNKLVKKGIKIDDLDEINDYLDQFKSTTRSRSPATYRYRSCRPRTYSYRI